MKYAYEDMSPEQFEYLVVCICQKLFGIAVQGFAKGPDGGRDAKFVGVAERFPSQRAPWEGITIIQAKHTNGINRSFSEDDFYSSKSKSTVIAKETPRIQELRRSRQLDHYMLFANRRLTARAEETIGVHLSQQCDIPRQSVYLCGLESIELWLKVFPEIPQMANIDPVDGQLTVNPDDLAEVIEALAVWSQNGIFMGIHNPPTPRVSYTDKNTLNNMTDDYAKSQHKKYLKETSKIANFLAAPGNLEFVDKYQLIVDEFQLKIISKRRDFQEFDRIMEYLVDLLYGRDPILNKHKTLTRAMLFYMYWNCDIGSTHAEAD